MYAVIYRYETNDGSVVSIMQSVSSDFADRIPAQIGSLLYTAIDTGDGTATTIVLYSDKDAAERGMTVSTQVRDAPERHLWDYREGTDRGRGPGQPGDQRDHRTRRPVAVPST
ncbi:hypothetical protein AB0L64_39945 [Kribbella sp. NPDC051936]|uniref:hypothetical protein n=1 Tax=Kribbella sp. NPDC051936 TaxID=3154946 RepID=UPI0034207536